MYKSIFNYINYSVIFFSFTLSIFFTAPGLANDDLDASNRPLQSVTLQLKWKHQFQFAGYYAALEKGFYRKAGLDVRILEIKDGEESTEKVIEGKVDFGIAMSDLILHRAKGQPVVALAAIFQHSPLIILAPKSSGIKNIHALKGKRLGMEAHSAELIAYIENEGISLEEFELVPHDYSVSKLISRKVEAISAYSTDEPFMLLDKGIEYSTFTPRAGGIDFYGDTLFTSETQIREHPERVAAFLDASLKGWQYALENSEEIIDLILSKYTQRHSREHLLFEAHHSKSLIMADVIQLGYMHIGRWNHIAQTYAKLGMIDKKFSLDGFLYAPNSRIDYGWLKRIIGILVTICSLLGLGALILIFFNRKLAVEVNERKRAEEALLQNENKLKSTLDATPFPVAVVDLNDDKIFYWSSSALDLFGHTAPTASQWYEIAYPDPEYRQDVIEKWKPFLEMARTSGEPVNTGEYRITCNDGSVKICELYASFISESLIVTFNNITEPKQAIEALRKSEENYKALAENPNSIVMRFDPKGNILFVNQYACQLFGYSFKEMIGKKSTDLIHPEINDDGQRAEDLFANFLNHPERFQTNENVNLTKDGKRLWISWANTPTYDESGQLTGLICTGFDTTDKKHMEKQLQQAQKMESIGTLAGGIAHDFNNILFPIMGHTEMLMEDIPEDSIFQSSLKEINTATLRAKNLVKQILTFSRQERNELNLIKMQPIIKETLKLIRSTIPSTIEIKHDIQTDCGVIKADPTQIHQIVMNLATNAYHAMEKTGGELKVSLKKVELGEHDVITPDMIPGEYVCLIVSDTGTGMDKVITEKIFDPFFTTKAIGKGTGMGLSVIHGIVTRMGGAIQVHSRSGKGTQFHVYLPVEKTLFEKQVTNSNVEIESGTEHILLIDDEEAILTMEKQMLERLGYQVTSCASSLEALETFRANPGRFDIVITDMAMPNMSGDKLSAELTKIRSDIPVLLCTGFSETMSEEKATSLGIKGFLFKPIVIKDLAQKIREVLDKN